MIDLKIAVAAVPKRMEHVKNEIYSQIPEKDVILMLDTVGPPTQGCRWSHIEGWQKLLDSGAEWCILLEDDILLCDNFIEKVKVRLEEAEKLEYKLIQFSSMRPAPDNWEKENIRWQKISWSFFWQDQANCMRFDMLRKFMRWTRDNWNAISPKGYIPDHTFADAYFQGFLKAEKLFAWECIPNLVDHNVHSTDEAMKHQQGQHTQPKIFGRWRDSKSFSKGAK